MLLMLMVLLLVRMVRMMGMVVPDRLEDSVGRRVTGRPSVH